MRRGVFRFLTVVACASTASAEPISWNTQMNCASDYYAYCSKFTAGSPGCHACMRSNRSKLSTACVSALIDDSILSRADGAPQKPKIAVAKSTPHQTSIANAKVKIKSPMRAPSSKVGVALLPANDNSQSAKAAAPPRSFDQREGDPQATAPDAATDQSRPRRKARQQDLALDQQTFEALKDRAPQFLAPPEIELTEATVPRQPSSEPR